jgi:hypothetical protein
MGRLQPGIVSSIIERMRGFDIFVVELERDAEDTLTRSPLR